MDAGRRIPAPANHRRWSTRRHRQHEGRTLGRGRGDDLIPTVVVLTGGIGTGKSTVAALLAERGAELVEADRLGHAVLDPEGPAFRRVAARWPQVVAGGVIDRRALGRIVFADPAELAVLEAITHPEINRLIGERIAASTSSIVVVEIPIPAKWLDESWQRIVVDADDSIRLARLRRRGLEIEEVESRMAAQPSRDEWLALGDHVVGNGGTLDELESEVDLLWGRITETSS